MTTLSILGSGDEAALDEFLATKPDLTMLIRSNVATAGLVDHGGFRQATYGALVEGPQVLAVAAHCWNGTLLLSAPVGTAEVTRLAVSRSKRAVRGLQGPWEEVSIARAALGLTKAAAITDAKDVLYALSLEDLVVPARLGDPNLECRSSREEDLDLLTKWRISFWIEALRASDSPALRSSCRREMAEAHRNREVRMLWDAGRPVSCLTFIARVAGSVMVGNVWTPPALRGRGFARAAVAAALRDERDRGIQRAVLTTDPAFASARAAYEAIGFRAVGDYGFVILAERKTE